MPDFKEIIAEKKAWREFMAQVKQLPSDYQLVFSEIQKYVYVIHPYQAMKILAEVFEVFQEGAARNSQVLELTSSDVAGFVDAIAESLSE